MLKYVCLLSAYFMRGLFQLFFWCSDFKMADREEHIRLDSRGGTGSFGECRLPGGSLFLNSGGGAEEIGGI